VTTQLYSSIGRTYCERSSQQCDVTRHKTPYCISTLMSFRDYIINVDRWRQITRNQNTYRGMSLLLAK